MMVSEFIQTERCRLHVRVVGSGRPVLLLHGFPDSSLGFSELGEALARSGFRAISADLRGYGLSDKPVGLEYYRAAELVEDVAALARSTGERQIALVGHDWGGTLAFCVAAKYPELLRKVVVLNAAHPASYARALRTSFQLVRSWYLVFFQLRGVAEWVITRRWCFSWLLRRLVARPDRLSRARIAASWRELVRPGVARAALSYYRAAVRWPIQVAGRIRAPTLVIWGDRDPALDIRLLDDLAEHVDQLTVQRIQGAGHFVHWDAPEAVAEHLARFLAD